jgi:hypothetical protein
MKLARFLGLAVILTGVFFAVFADDAFNAAPGAVPGTEKLEPPYVKVIKPFSNVYVRLDPKSEIIRQAKKGETLELLRSGDSWYEVKVDGKVGYLQVKNGKPTKAPGGNALVFLLYVVLLLGCAGAVVLYIKKQQLSPSASAAGGVDDDLDDLD